MTTRNAFLSPPALAGMALLAIVVGAMFGFRGGLGSTPPPADTEVAGTVIERSEPAVAADEPAGDEDPIVVPLPDDNDPAESEPEPDAQPPAAPAPAPAPQNSPVGIVRDTPAPVAPDNGNGNDNGNGGNGGNGGEDPDPDPTRRPRPDATDEPTPKPTPKPTPSATETETEEPTEEPTPADVALRTGEGHSRDTAIADNGDWLFREVSRHGSPGPDTSREAQARIIVTIGDDAKAGEGAVRPFQCRAWVTAGDERLTTARDHVFEVALLALDANGNVTDTVASVIERHAYDLDAGEDTSDAPMATTPVELDAQDGVSYTCGVRYRER